MEPSDSLVMEIFGNQFPDFCGTKGLVQHWYEAEAFWQSWSVNLEGVGSA